MAFGRRKQDSGQQDSGQQDLGQRDSDQRDSDQGAASEVGEGVESAGSEGAVSAVAVSDLSGDADGPFDIEDFDDPAEATVARLDLGSVLIPMRPDCQV